MIFTRRDGTQYKIHFVQGSPMFKEEIENAR